MGANLSGATLRDVNLSGVNLREANLSGATLGDANLSGAKLEGAYLSGAELGKANLSGASLWISNLSDANLCGADLRQAVLHLANLENARVMDVRYLGGGTRDCLRDFLHWASKGRIGKSENLPPRFEEKKQKLWEKKWLRVFYPFRIFAYLWQCRGWRIMHGFYKGINVAECYGDAAFRRDAMDQDYIDNLFSRWCREPRGNAEIWSLRALLFGAWGLIDYGRSFSRILLWGTFAIFIFGGIYADLARTSAVEYTPNMGVKNGFTPYYVAAVTFSTLGFTDIAIPYNFTAQCALIANALFGYVVFGLLLSVLANVVARRAGG